MKDTIIIKGQIGGIKKFKDTFVTIGIVIAAVLFLLAQFGGGGFDDPVVNFFINFIFSTAIGLPFILIGVIPYARHSKTELNVSATQIYGCASGKQVTLPIDTVYSISMCASNGIAINSSLGHFKFLYIENRGDVYSEINKLLNEQKRKAAETEKAEYRKRCKVCGHIFCYTQHDLNKNAQIKKDAEWESNMSIAKTLFVSNVAGGQSQQSAYDLEARIVDYSKCPKCGSSNLTDATNEDIERAQAPQGQIVQQTSNADELKKYKDLLDQGIITQEEFDAKKKQLLGL